MIVRSLRIRGQSLVNMLNGKPNNFRVIKNALPEDAKCVDATGYIDGSGGAVVWLKITSSVFQVGDACDLPDPVFKSINSD
jgi:hypothetical protein